MVGVIKRGMRTVREKAHPVMEEFDVMQTLIHPYSEKSQEPLRNSSIPEMWPESMKYAVWLRNRSTTRALDNKQTPVGSSPKVVSIS
jgi:hypothetical protein